jgi:GH25 family lysozyme M1 (1,4-beta-N-acetylmuramidase)
MNRKFADISSNDAGFDAAKYAAWGPVIVSIKVTEGTTYVNPLWKAWTREAHQHRLGVLFYHFARPGDGGDQARHFLDQIRGSCDPGHGDGICLDLERMGGVADPERFLHQFETVCVSRGHRALVLYSEESYMEEHPKMRTKRSWMAAYPSLRWRFRNRVWAHQYTDHEDVPGVGISDCSFLSPRAYLWHRLHRPR